MTAVPEIKKDSVNLDTAAEILTFETEEGFDVAAKLTELTDSVKYFEGFEVKK